MQGCQRNGCRERDVAVNASVANHGHGAWREADNIATLDGMVNATNPWRFGPRDDQLHAARGGRCPRRSMQREAILLVAFPAHGCEARDLDARRGALALCVAAVGGEVKKLRHLRPREQPECCAAARACVGRPLLFAFAAGTAAVSNLQVARTHTTKAASRELARCYCMGAAHGLRAEGALSLAPARSRSRLAPSRVRTGPRPKRVGRPTSLLHPPLPSPHSRCWLPFTPVWPARRRAAPWATRLFFRSALPKKYAPTSAACSAKATSPLAFSETSAAAQETLAPAPSRRRRRRRLHPHRHPCRQSRLVRPSSTRLCSPSRSPARSTTSTRPPSPTPLPRP